MFLVPLLLGMAGINTHLRVQALERRRADGQGHHPLSGANHGAPSD